jgi:hypothetical protein
MVKINSDINSLEGDYNEKSIDYTNCPFVFYINILADGRNRLFSCKNCFAPDHGTDLVDEEKPLIFSKDIEYEVERIEKVWKYLGRLFHCLMEDFLLTERLGRVILLGTE